MIFVNQILWLMIFPCSIFPRLILVPLFALNRFGQSFLGARSLGWNAGRSSHRPEPGAGSNSKSGLCAIRDGAPSE